MIEAIQPRPLEHQQFVQASLVEGTGAKVKRIALIVFGGIALFFVGTMLLLSFSATLLKSAIIILPIAVAGGGIIWLIKRYRDYHAPESLKQFRNEALQKPLQETIKKHTLEYMFYYGIPEPKDFPELYRMAIQSMSVKEAIRFYETVKKAKDLSSKNSRAAEFEIPSPIELKDKWLRESSRLDMMEILDTFNNDLEKLCKYGILIENSKEYQALVQAEKNYKKALEEDQGMENTIQKKFLRDIAGPLRKFHQFWIQQKNRDRDPDLENWIIRIEKEILQMLNNPQGKRDDKAYNLILQDDLINLFGEAEWVLTDGHKKFKTEIVKYEQTRNKEIKKIPKIFEKKREKIVTEYQRSLQAPLINRIAHSALGFIKSRL